MFQNAGEKGRPHLDPDDPPRRRANKRRGIGTFANDRPPIAGVVGRESGELRLEVERSASPKELQPWIEWTCRRGARVNTDESKGYERVAASGRTHQTVRHKPGRHKEWAKDEDGDGIREVHSNTMEGIWTGLRNFLRPFRGVSKWFLYQYVAVFEWTYNHGHDLAKLLRAMLRPITSATA